MPDEQKRGSNVTAVIIAIIGALATILVALINRKPEEVKPPQITTPSQNPTESSSTSSNQPAHIPSVPKHMPTPTHGVSKSPSLASRNAPPVKQKIFRNSKSYVLDNRWGGHWGWKTSHSPDSLEYWSIQIPFPSDQVTENVYSGTLVRQFWSNHLNQAGSEVAMMDCDITYKMSLSATHDPQVIWFSTSAGRENHERIENGQVRCPTPEDIYGNTGQKEQGQLKAIDSFRKIKKEGGSGLLNGPTFEKGLLLKPE